jgi:hypothetical protein
MGRAIGLFLLVVGIGLAAYGLPTSDSVATLTGVAATGPGGSAFPMERPSPSVTRLGANDALPAYESTHRKALPAPTRVVPAVQATVPAAVQEPVTAPQLPVIAKPAPAVTPMDKVRAAGQAARGGRETIDEAVASAQSMRVPAPVAVPAPPAARLVPSAAPNGPTRAATAPPGAPQAAAQMKATVPVPSIVANAKREAEASLGRPKGAAPAGANAQAAGRFAAPTATTVTTGSLPAAPLVPAGADFAKRVVAAPGPAPAPGSLTDPTAAADPAIAGRADGDIGPKPRLGNEPRLAQRYSPPVYLGRNSNGPSSSYRPPQRMRAGEQWDSIRRGGI